MAGGLGLVAMDSALRCLPRMFEKAFSTGLRLAPGGARFRQPAAQRICGFGGLITDVCVVPVAPSRVPVRLLAEVVGGVLQIFAGRGFGIRKHGAFLAGGVRVSQIHGVCRDRRLWAAWFRSGQADGRGLPGGRLGGAYPLSRDTAVRGR